MAQGPAARQDADGSTRPRAAPAFDAREFDELCEMIGLDGVLEMATIFETETRQRLRRLNEGNQTFTTLVREMHTLKGAAGTVGAPRLNALGAMFERAAQENIAPPREALDAIADALEAWLEEVRLWRQCNPRESGA